MGKLKNLLINTAENEAFNEIERQAKQRKEAVLQALHDENARLGLYKPDEHLRLMDELAIARVCVRELGDRLARLEKPWVGLTDKEIYNIDFEKHSFYEAARIIEEILRMRNA